MNYHIYTTLGPASDRAETWRELLAAGATEFRLNTSHLSLEQLSGWLERLEPFLGGQSGETALVLDLQGSKWRLGQFATCELAEGQAVELVHAAEAGQPGVLPVPHADFFRAAPGSSGEIVLNDAKVRLRLEAVEAGVVKARVTQAGSLSPNKGVTFAASDYRSEALNDKDRAILEQTQGLRFIRYAISYVKDAAEMAGYRALVQAISGRRAYLIAKLERGPAMAEAAQIAASADELWVCRGDLGAEVGLRAMAEAVSRYTKDLTRLPVPSIMAGQVLEHMTGQPVPTRSEVCYLHDTLAQGYRGFVLSDETAVGQWPVESCRTAAMFKD